MISERDIIYISKKQASLTVAAIIAFCILVFMLGYFWGKQSVIDEFGQKIVQDLAQDAGDYDAGAQSSQDKADIDETETTSQQPESVEVVQVASEPVPNVTEQSSEVVSSENNNKQWKAVLVGFGTKSHATAFMKRLQKHDIETLLRVRESKSSSGKHKKQWYQVLTTNYATKKDLEQVIAQIQKLERIKSSDVKIL